MLGSAGLSSETLAAVLDQSVDCVKLLNPDGTVQWMNRNGLCAMEIDDFDTVRGQHWQDLWPEEARDLLARALSSAKAGQASHFKASCPTAKGTPRWWDVTVSPVQDVTGREAGYLAISRDITDAEAAREALEIAAAELRHRLKNTYTIIGTLMSGFARGSPEREAFAEEMVERLSALSNAQALFSAQDAPCRLDQLIQALVGPFKGAGATMTIGSLPATPVSKGQADAIALVLGELTVNSVKHGALSKHGQLHIGAEGLPNGFRVTWSEQSARSVRATGRAGGQGLELIARIVRARHGRLALQWHSHGLDVTIEFETENQKQAR
ncbi:PAS domain-containing protein [Allosphingosinicella deserti]|uniref:histidine kinase n=1 Tax=Allosphingosinicella deserti TaxID=2116704 RepID=A0A2P7QEG7_9SPHN|nr:PAS domain-containing protein [Sphingomonas deserti]PSJ36334.1 hypothetical protein C7I55_26980 [Sphingomonas deserti]